MRACWIFLRIDLGLSQIEHRQYDKGRAFHLDLLYKVELRGQFRKCECKLAQVYAKIPRPAANAGSSEMYSEILRIVRVFRSTSACIYAGSDR